ncbi:MAG: dihydroorotase [Hahellaceae bacterium]|nr:dihydroorotase [Hahellaceae bacterium]
MTVSPSPQELLIRLPDDWHLHLRDDDYLTQTVADTARCFGRAIIMPNLVPPVTTAAQAIAYRERILASCPQGNTFEPLMTMYLTDNTSPEEIIRAKANGVVACKLYPAGATTNSDSGVTRVDKIYPVLEAMEKIGLPLLIHGEVTDSEIDIFDREQVFIDRTLSPLVQRLPHLKVVLEHITTRQAVDFVEAASANVAATITAHHLLYNRNHMLVGGIRPHLFCLPILKRNIHQSALLKAATSGNPSFFLGTDSAPHAIGRKEAACGCAGCYTAPAAIELYAEAFELMGALDKLEDFASHFGPDFYGLPKNSRHIRLRKEAWQLPATLPFGQSEIAPLRAGETVNWRVIAIEE